MEPVRTYQDLVVWQKAVDLVVEIYAFTETFPDLERFGLTSQLRRAAVSIPSNIAEGYRRKGIGDYIRFLHIAYGSASEIETQLVIASRLKFGEEQKRQETQSALTEVLKMLNRLITSASPK